MKHACHLPLFSSNIKLQPENSSATINITSKKEQQTYRTLIYKGYVHIHRSIYVCNTSIHIYTSGTDVLAPVWTCSAEDTMLSFFPIWLYFLVSPAKSHWKHFKRQNKTENRLLKSWMIKKMLKDCINGLTACLAQRSNVQPCRRGMPFYFWITPNGSNMKVKVLSWYIS